MTDDYTPTTAEVIRKYATGATWQRQRFSAGEDEFIRWLAAHDAQKRAEWEAEQGELEWEYAYELIESDTRDVLTRSGSFDTEQAARHWAPVAHRDESDPEYPPLDTLIVRRRKAGPWVPVNESGDAE